MPGRIGANTWLWATIAAAAFGWALIAVVFAAIGPPAYVPHIFHNAHVEHLIAFYAMALLAAAGLPRAPLGRLIAALAVLAVVLAGVRMFMPYHRLSAAEDLLADIAGALAALAPILVGRFRERAERGSRPGAENGPADAS
ncbi:MAG: hypothetical protein JO127_00040 [Caulobacteraceae bacterium]|nr:hypothetical protein [Caulobacteraceae bacterium]